MNIEAERQTGGSDIATIGGVAPASWPKLIDLWARKTGKGWTPQKPTIPQLRGLALEPLLRRLAEDEYGLRLHGPLNVKCQHPWQRASLDDWTEEGGEKVIIELKTCSPFARSDWSDDSIPIYYDAQLQWYFSRTGWKHAHVVTLVGDDLIHREVEARPDRQAFYDEMAERFERDFIRPQTMPPLDFSDSYSQVIRALYTQTSGRYITADNDCEQWAQRFLVARDNLKHAEEAESAARKFFEDRIRDADGMQGDGWRITWKISKGRETVDWSQVVREAEVAQELIARHTTRKPYRPFRFTSQGGTNGTDE